MTGTEQSEGLPEKWRALADDIREAQPGDAHPSADMAERLASELQEKRLFDDEDRDTFDAAVGQWGIDAQADMAEEECAELIVASKHWARGRDGAVDEMLEELADVRIMYEQLAQFLGRERVEQRVREKMDRLRERLEDGDVPEVRTDGGEPQETGNNQFIPVAKCPNCGYIYGDDLDYRFPSPSVCLKCDEETENTTMGDRETVESLAGEKEVATDGGEPQETWMEHYGRQSHPDGDRCDLEYCEGCGLAFTTTELGHYVDSVDVGGDAEGGTAQVFRQEADRLGREWLGFEEEDVGAWCDSCSDRLQRKRSAELMTDGGTDSTGSKHPKPALIILKCLECKRPTIFRLRSCHVEDSHEYRAKSVCRSCVRDNPFHDLRYRDLAPNLVENQKLDLGFHEADRSLDTGDSR